jgi:uncharacterized repeat protein (TIGR01451 family)
MAYRRLLRVLTLPGLVLTVLVLIMAMLTFVHAQGSAASITIVKEADQTVIHGSTVTFTIAVTNTGDVTLTNVTVSDAQAPVCDRTFTRLLTGEHQSYSCAVSSVTGDFANSATVTGTLEGGGVVTDVDTAFVDVISPAIEIAKTPDVQTVVSGSAAIFTIAVTNTGDVTLTNVTVSDAQAPACDRTFTRLLTGEHQSYGCAVSSVTDDFVNSATVTGRPPIGDWVTDVDTAFVDVISPAVKIAKTPDVQTVASGATVNFTIAVTNTGDVTLTNVTVSDAQDPGCDRTFTRLLAGEHQSHECAVSNVTDDFVNSATVTGRPPIGDWVTDVDTAFVDVVSPAIEIAKTPDVQMVASGATVNFTIAITNTGDVALTNVAVSDAQAPACDRTFTRLLAWERQSYGCAVHDVVDGFINSAVVTGRSPAGTDVTDADAAQVRLDETLPCPSEMAAYWNLDETAGPPYDDFYDGHDGVCAGTCPVPTAGYVDGGQAFNGTSMGIDVLTVPGDDSLNWGAQDSFSIEFWMKADSFSSCSRSNEVIVGRDDHSNSQLHWWVGIGCWVGGKPAFVLRDNDGEIGEVVGSTDLTDGSWYHFVAVRDASTNENHIYINGTEEASESVSYSAGFGSQTAAVNVGWLNLSHGFHFHGVLDEVATYDRALSPEEVRQHHNEGLAGRWYCEAGAYKPVIVSAPVTEATVGRPYVYDVEAVGDPEPTYALLANPVGMMVEPATGVISWTPTVAQEGAHEVEVQASNSEGAVTQSFTVVAVEGTLCPTSMIAYWKLNETGGPPYDDFYDDHDGVCGVQCPAPATAYVGGGQAFNGSTTEINVPADVAFDWGENDSFSIEFWLQTNSASTCSGNQVVVGRDDDSTPLHWWAGCQDGGEAAFYLRDTGNTISWAVGSTDLTDGYWHHVVAVRDASANEIRLYVDGVGEDSTPVDYNAGFASLTAALNIGWLNLSQGFHFSGVADEIALYDRVLSSGEIEQHYRDGEAGAGYCINPDISVRKTADPKVVYAWDSMVTYVYTVTNSGDAPLSDITLRDDKCGSVTFVGGDDGDDRLDLVEAWIYRCSMDLHADITNTVIVTGIPALGGPVSDTARVAVDVIDPKIAIAKVADPTLIYAGDTVTYTYTVTNPGDDPLSSVSVSDDRCSVGGLVAGDDNDNYRLDPDETWTYTCSTVLSADTTNTARATGIDSASGTVSDTAMVFVDVRDSRLSVLKRANDDDVVFDFSIAYGSGDQSFSLRNGELQNVEWGGFPDVAPGLYTITETPVLEWELLSITCTNGTSLVAPDTPAVTIDLQSGQDVRCTFTNLRSTRIFLPLVLKLG